MAESRQDQGQTGGAQRGTQPPARQGSGQGQVSKDDLIADLNEALAYEYQAVMMYNTYAACVEGLHRGELKDLFEAEIGDELNHAKFLSDKVSALGGAPVTEAKQVKEQTDAKGMLEEVLSAEEDAIQRYVDLMKKAETFGDYGLANNLHEIISDETNHKEETEKFLRGNWT